MGAIQRERKILSSLFQLYNLFVYKFLYKFGNYIVEENRIDRREDYVSIFHSQTNDLALNTCMDVLDAPPIIIRKLKDLENFLADSLVSNLHASPVKDHQEKLRN